jgi:hypothetical protein
VEQCYEGVHVLVCNVVVSVVVVVVIRLQQYAREARKEYSDLGTKDLSQLKTFVKGLPKLLLLDR